MFLYTSLFKLRLGVCSSLFVFALIPTLARTQTVNLGDDVSRPTPGVGHDYIKGFNETVNPADGNLSIKIDLGVPKARGFTLPIALTYNSGEVHHFTSEEQGCGALSATGCNGSAYYVTDRSQAGFGWSDTLPYTAATFEALYVNSSVAQSGGGTIWTGACPISTSYNFYDPNGGSHMLGIAAIGLFVYGGEGQYSESFCNTATYGGPKSPLFTGYQYFGVPIGGDDQVSAEMEALCDGNNGTTEYNCQDAAPGFTVTDSSGTTYIFPANGFYLNAYNTASGASPTISETGFIYPTMIEDRNGNIVQFQQVGETDTYNIVDTAGRTIVQTQLPQAGSYQPASYDVDGLNYKLGYTTTAATYTVSPVQVDTWTSFGWNQSAVVCNFQDSVSESSDPVLQTITLPNGQAYTFDYSHNTYGLVDKITYPDGGWVQYTWGLSSNPSTFAQYDGTGNIQANDMAMQSGYCQFEYQTPVILERQVGYSDSTTPAQVQTFSYTTTWNSTGNQWTSKSTSVITTDNVTGLSSETIYNYLPIGQPTPPNAAGHIPGQLPVESTINYYDWSTSNPPPTTTPIKQVTKTWSAQNILNTETTTLNNNPNLTTEITYCYNVSPGAAGSCTPAVAGGNALYASSNFPIELMEKDEFGFNSSSYYRATTYNYYKIQSPCFWGPTSGPCQNSFNTETYGLSRSAVVPCQIVVYNSSATRVAETDAYYDGNSTVCGGNSIASNSLSAATTPLGTHDDPVSNAGSQGGMYYGTGAYTSTPYGPYLTRGNLTQLTKWSSTGTSLTQTLTYDETGQVLSKTDACGNGTCTDMGTGNHTTTYSYADSPSGGNAAGNSNAYITQIKYPTTPNGITQQENFSYNYPTGELASSKDANNQVTTYEYNDPLFRPTLTTFPDKGQTQIAYNDSAPSVQTSQLLTSGTCKSTLATLDGMGHVIHSQSGTGCAASGSFTADTTADTVYNGMGQAYSKTNPYRGSIGSPTAAPTNGTTFSYSDALGRPIETVEADGSVLQTCYNGIASTAPTKISNCNSLLSKGNSGSWVDSSDESGNHWQRVSDAFGRLVAVMEPNGTSQTPIMETDYVYDYLNNLTSVTQYGAAYSASGNPVARAFFYNSLSQLLTSTNPESGPITYSYDLNGNLSSKTSPAVDQPVGATPQTISYCYDNLNRMTSKFENTAPNCSSSSGAADTYTYDVSTISGATNDIGRLTDEQSLIGGTLVAESSPYSYDPMGRLWAERQTPFTPNGMNYTFNYTYDLAGSPITANNGLSPTSTAPLTFTYTYDDLERLNTATTTQPSTWSTTTYPTTIFSATPQSTPLELNTSAYDPMVHLVNAAFSMATPGATPSLVINRAYDKRGRINEEFDYGAGTTVSTKSVGSIGIVGTELSVPVPAQPATSGAGQFIVSITSPNASGTITLTVNGTSLNYSFTATTQELSSGAIPQGLVAAINGNSSMPVTASYNGSGSYFVIPLTAKATGTVSNYSMSASASGSYFSIVNASTALSGGTNAVSAYTAYDAGTITANINGINATATWGQSSTTTSLITALASSLNSLGSSFLVATASGSDIYLTSKSTGSTVDYPVTMTYNDTSSFFTYNPSFGDASLGMEGGDKGTIYSYVVPEGGYAPNGNLLTYWDSVMGNWNYGYDTLNRLTSSKNTATTTPGAQYASVTGCWTYDGFGNRTLEAYSNVTTTPCATGANDNLQLTITTPEYLAQPTTPMNNQLAGLSYDGAGNVLTDSRNSYLYDAEGRLCAVNNGSLSMWQYLYDASGTRVAKGTLSTWPTSCQAPTTANGFTLTNQYLLDSSGDQITELDGSGNWKHTNAWEGGHLSVTYDPLGEHYYIADPLGTKRVQATAAGLAELYCLTLPWSNSLTNLMQPDCVNSAGVLSTAATEHTFTQKEQDNESGNDYFGARYLSIINGHWLSPDWSAKEEPVPYAKLDDPQTLNLYAYVDNNPLFRADPDGHCCWDELVDTAVGSGKELYNQVAGLASLVNAPIDAGLRASGVNFQFGSPGQFEASSSTQKNAMTSMAIVTFVAPGAGEAKEGLWMAGQIGNIESKVTNIATKLLTPETLSAASREANGGMAVAKGGGGLFSHVEKVQQGISGLNRQLTHAEKLLNRPGLSEKAATALQGQVKNIQDNLAIARAAITPHP
jgi:RHS repeat-associated protein